MHLLLKRFLTTLVGAAALLPLPLQAALPPAGTYVQLSYQNPGSPGQSANIFELDSFSLSNTPLFHLVSSLTLPGQGIRKTVMSNLGDPSPKVWWITQTHNLVGAMLHTGRNANLPLAKSERAFAMTEYADGEVLVATGLNRLLLTDSPYARDLLPQSKSVINPSIYGQIIDMEMVSSSDFVAITDSDFLLKVSLSNGLDQPGRIDFEADLTQARLLAGAPKNSFDPLQVQGDERFAWVLIQDKPGSAMVTSTVQPRDAYVFGYGLRRTHNAKPQQVLPLNTSVNNVELCATTRNGLSPELRYRLGNEYRAIELNSGVTTVLDPNIFDLAHVGPAGRTHLSVDHPKYGHAWISRPQLPLYARHAVQTVTPGPGTAPAVVHIPPKAKDSGWAVLLKKEWGTLRSTYTRHDLANLIGAKFELRIRFGVLGDEIIKKLGLKVIGREPLRLAPLDSKIASALISDTELLSILSGQPVSACDVILNGKP